MTVTELTDQEEEVQPRRFRPYPEYRDSGVEWLGQVPAHWSVKRLKFLAPARISKLDTKPEDAVYVGLEHVESWTGRLLLESQPASVDSIVSSFAAGDVLLDKLRPYLAKAARPAFDGVCTSEILPLRPNRECIQSYLMYCLLNALYVRWLDSLTYGAKMPHVNPNQVGNSRFPLPPKPEQLAIAEFLDRETARIDALVAKKERLIELLREKRTALITRAVTRGLDPNVPMKDSGVEWLGEVPAHWEVQRLKHHGALVGGSGFPHNYQGIDGEALPFYKVGDLSASSNGRFMGQAQNTISLQIAARLRAHVIPKNSIVYAKIGVALLLNRRRLTTIPCCLDNNMSAYIPRRGLASEWALYWTAIVDFAALAQPGAVPSLSEGDQADIPIVIPPMSEQHAITRRLDEETTMLDALTTNVREAIDHLNEFRTALVSAAVTGKIDIRKESA